MVSGLGSAFLPSADRVALAQDGQALGDTLILAGPGGQYGILTVAPAGAVMSVDGDPVDGYYPVTYDGISGWTAIGLLQVADGGGNGGGGGGNGGGNNRGVTHEVRQRRRRDGDRGPIFPMARAGRGGARRAGQRGTYGPGARELQRRADRRHHP